MKMTMLYMYTIMSLTIMMMMLVMLISKSAILDMQKMSPFECGFNPLSKKRMPFSVHFFMIAIIFLIFDVEIVIIIPMIYTIKFSLIKFWMITTICMIMMLLMGLYYEWYNGLLNWTK